MILGGTTLLIDAGNTRVKFGWMRDERGVREPETLALAHSELGRLPAWLAKLPVAPGSCLGVSVAHSTVPAQVEDSVAQHLQLRVRWLHSAARAGNVVNLYDVPEQLGDDRWVALIGLSGHTPGPALLATFGTATTIDALGPVTAAPQKEGACSNAASASRKFEGGLILPGPELMRQSLVTGTAALPYALGDSAAFPRNTHSAISSGIAAAQAGAVIRQWRHALDQLGAAPQLYCTGGGWPLVAEEVTALLARMQADMAVPVTAPVWLHAPVLDGLATLASESVD